MSGRFYQSDEGLAFIASADSRETSLGIMQAITRLAENRQEAEAIWRGEFYPFCAPSDIWEAVTYNGLYESADYCWGGNFHWWEKIRPEE